MSIIVCPKCREKLNIDGYSLRCVNNHSFDFSREGYVNLLLTNKSGDKKGDSKESAHARHNFLAKGYYDVLKNAIGKKMQGTVLDICCGEGYYDTYDGELYGFDISKEMGRLAAKLTSWKIDIKPESGFYEGESETALEESDSEE